MTRKDVIAQVLASLYSRDGKVTPGSMVEACAEDLDKRYDNLVQRGNDLYASNGAQSEVMLYIWNWFAGGGTAEIAAARVIEAVSQIPRN